MKGLQMLIVRRHHTLVHTSYPATDTTHQFFSKKCIATPETNLKMQNCAFLPLSFWPLQQIIVCWRCIPSFLGLVRYMTMCHWDTVEPGLNVMSHIGRSMPQDICWSQECLVRQVEKYVVTVATMDIFKKGHPLLGCFVWLQVLFSTWKHRFNS